MPDSISNIVFGNEQQLFKHLLLEDDEPAVKLEDKWIGPYRLMKLLGEGGFGQVWLAEQNEPVRREVALKLLKRGMDSDQVLARFSLERQALASMDHPNIAALLDAGSTPDGRPYFVMDYVQGLPVTTWCQEKHASIPENIGLFKQICSGLQHAAGLRDGRTGLAFGASRRRGGSTEDRPHGAIWRPTGAGSLRHGGAARAEADDLTGAVHRAGIARRHGHAHLDGQTSHGLEAGP